MKTINGKFRDYICPKCGGNMVKTIFGIGCENYNNDKKCSMAISDVFMGKKLTDNQQDDLLIKGETEEIFGFIVSGGRRISGKLYLDENKEVRLRSSDGIPTLICPLCGNKLRRVNGAYQCCGNLDETCNFVIFDKCGRRFSVCEIRRMLEGERIHVHGLWSKKYKRTFDAIVYLEEDEINPNIWRITLQDRN